MSYIIVGASTPLASTPVRVIAYSLHMMLLFISRVSSPYVESRTPISVSSHVLERAKYQVLTCATLSTKTDTHEFC